MGEEKQPNRFRFRAWWNDSHRMEHDVERCFLRGNTFANYSEHSECILMQSTGLLDKNGKEIFESDIIIHHIRKDLDVKRRIIWLDGMFTCPGFAPEEVERCLACGSISRASWPLCSMLPGRTMEVIGNYYENPELLNEAKSQ